MNITALSSTSFLITMSPPPRDLANGLICGYRVWYGISTNDFVNTSTEIEVLADKAAFKSTMYFNTTASVIISNLFKFTVYEVYVSAFTVKGIGVKGNYSSRTLQDGK